MTYTENLVARFGKVPSPQALAFMENAAMRAGMGLQRGQTMNLVGSQCVTPDMRQRLREAALEKGRQRMEELLSAMTKPATPDDLCLHLKWSITTVRRALNRAKLEGRVKITQRKVPQIWEKVPA